MASYPSPSFRDPQGPAVVPWVVADALPVGLVVGAPNGYARFVNRAWRRLTGQAEDAWLGHGWLQVLAPSRRGVERDALLSAVRRGRPYEADWVTSGPPAAAVVMHITAVPEFSARYLDCFVAVATDVTEERARMEQLVYRATHDSLTGLYNRAQFLEYVAKALARRRVDSGPHPGVLFVDVDNLKDVNDRLGHDAGDRHLRAAAARISSAVRPADIVARYGGDEFTVLCDGLQDAVEAAALAERIVRRAAIASDAAAHSPSVRLSVGFALAEVAESDADSVVRRADLAMYADKRRRAGDSPAA